MNKPNLITEASWLTLMGLIYFIGIYTSDRNLSKLKKDFSSSLLKEIKKKRLIKPFNFQVLLTMFIFTIPFWFYNVLVNSIIYPYLVYLSLGCFLSPLVLSSKAAPSGHDLKRPAVYLFKWIVSKFDSWFKNTVVLCLCISLSFIPCINHLGNKLSEIVFPIVQNKSGTIYFNETFNGILLLVIATHIIRLSSLLLNSIWFSFIYCFAIAFCWVDLQWLINENFPKQSLIHLVTMTFITTVIWDLILDLTLATIEIICNNDK